MNEEYSVDRINPFHRYYLFIKSVFLLNYLVGLFLSINYLDLSDISTILFIAFILEETVSVINISHYIYIFNKNYGRVFPNFTEYYAWKHNIGLSRFNFKRVCLFIEFILRALIIVFNWPPGQNTLGDKKLIYIRLSILLLEIATAIKVVGLLIFVIPVISMYITRLVSSYKIPSKIVELPRLTDISISDNCSICMDSPSNMVWTRSKCGHHFHRECIIKWIDKSGLNTPCPMCRKPVLV
jgi:hypothetical protein